VGPRRTWAVADLSDAYADQATRVSRGVAMIDGRSVIVEDDFEAPTSVAYVSGFHTRASVAVHSREATLSLGGEHLTARILAPPDAWFEVTPARQAPPQAANDGVVKLEVRLAPRRQERVVVQLGVGTLPSVKVPPLQGWATALLWRGCERDGAGLSRVRIGQGSRHGISTEARADSDDRSGGGGSLEVEAR